MSSCLSGWSLPSRELLRIQSDWLSEARSRLLRLAEIGNRKRILDLGAGYGLVVPELQRRCNGTVMALDRSLAALASLSTKTQRVCADATGLPLASQSFDLVYSQNVLLWINSTISVVREVHRILSPGGVWVLFEPDYGGLMEYPPEVETREIWISALQRAGANPFLARSLPSLLLQTGFRARVDLIAHLVSPDSIRFDFLASLPLTENERTALVKAKQASEKLDPTQQVAHLPYFLILAERR